jgi:hypothetical protein
MAWCSVEVQGQLYLLDLRQTLFKDAELKVFRAAVCFNSPHILSVFL